MKRLVFIVEGDTEILLVENTIMPYLYGLGFQNPITCQTITTNRKQHKKGGVVSYGSFENELKRTFSQGDVIITTLVDFFKLPTDFPGYTLDASLISNIESAVHEKFNYNPDLIPYVQLHEVEALMFSSMDGFDLVIDDEKELEQIEAIIRTYPNPEDINNSPQTSPSKRLAKIFNYDKTGDGEMIFDMVGIDAMLAKCPRFANWIETIINRLHETL